MLNDLEVSKILECINSKIDYFNNCDLPDDYCNKEINELNNLWQKVYQML